MRQCNSINWQGYTNRQHVKETNKGTVRVDSPGCGKVENALVVDLSKFFDGVVVAQIEDGHESTRHITDDGTVS
jgi:hypothetical protein